MKKLLPLLSCLLLIGCGEKLPDDSEIKQALENAVKTEELEWRDQKGLVTHEPHLTWESSDGSTKSYAMGWGIDRVHLRGESEPYSGWVKLTAEAVFMYGPHKENKDPEAVRGLWRVKGGHWEGRKVTWFRNGQIKLEGTFKQGKMDGPVREWHDNGQKASEETYKDGIRNGLSVGWDRNGSKTREFIYKGNSLDWKERLADSPLEYGPHKENSHHYAGLVKEKGRPVVPVSITITDCDEKASGALTIPATIDGFPVTSIGLSAFGGCRSLTSITLPDSITSIGGAAFTVCESLTSITIADGVTSIGESAFDACSSLTSITLPDSVTSIGEEAFSRCYKLTSITIGNGVTSIGHRAFARCENLSAVTFLGDAPKLNEWKDIINGGTTAGSLGATPTIYRKPEAKGWEETWGGRPVKLINEKP